MTSGSDLEKVDAAGYTSLEMLYRFIEVHFYYSAMDGLLRAKFAYPKVNFRYVVTPSKSLQWNLTPFAYNKATVDSIFDQGVSDAKKIMDKGEGIHFDDLTQYFALKKKNDSRVEGINFEDFLNKRDLEMAGYSVLDDEELSTLFLQE